MRRRRRKATPISKAAALWAKVSGPQQRATERLWVGNRRAAIDDGAQLASE
jgi:hypothetical protein